MQNKVFLITGATGGIGSEITKLLSTNGATCILLARNIKKLEVLYDAITIPNPPTSTTITPATMSDAKISAETGAATTAKHAIYPFNLTNASFDDFSNLRMNIDKNFGALDGIIHAAGQVGNLTPIEQYDVTQWFTIMQTNLNASFLLTQALLPLLKRSVAAKVIFTINKVGIENKAFFGAYAVANAGLQAFANVLAAEYESSTNLKFKTILTDKVNTKLYHVNHPAVDKNTLVNPKIIATECLQLLDE